MSKLPTDREVLKCMYETYESFYPGVQLWCGSWRIDPYIAIVVPTVAEKLKCNADLLFGRLYYHLDFKHRYKQDNGALVPLFYLKVGEKAPHCSLSLSSSHPCQSRARVPQTALVSWHCHCGARLVSRVTRCQPAQALSMVTPNPSPSGVALLRSALG
jgi:hypothetical protein